MIMGGYVTAGNSFFVFHYGLSLTGKTMQITAGNVINYLLCPHDDKSGGIMFCTCLSIRPYESDVVGLG